MTIVTEKIPSSPPQFIQEKIDNVGSKRSYKFTFIFMLFVAVVSSVLFGGYKAIKWHDQHLVSFRTPFQNPIVITSRVKTDDYQSKVQQIEALEQEVKSLKE